MKRTLGVAVTAATMAFAALAIAQPASADTVDGVSCTQTDTQAAVGTTIHYDLTDCDNGIATVLAGSPTVDITPASQGRLVWQQEIERATTGTACPEGWGGSWAQWANRGQGGATCLRLIDWGAGPYIAMKVDVTINTDADLVEVGSYEQWAAGCNATPVGSDWYPDRNRVGCPPL